MSAAVAVLEEDDEAEEGSSGVYDFDLGFQKKVVTLMARDPVFAARAKDLVKPEYFTENAMGFVVDMVGEFARTYKTVPDRKIIPMLLKDAFAKSRIRDDLKDEVKKIVRDIITDKTDLSGSKFVLDKVADFARHQAVEKAMIDSFKHMEKRDWNSIHQLMKEALTVGNVDTVDEYDYWTEIDNRTKIREDWKAGILVKTGISSGVSEIDAHLYHGGWGREELTVIMGAPKAGKSLSLGEFTKNASLKGYNALYATLEVAPKIIADRIDAALSDTAMRLLKDDPQTVARKIKAAHAKSGAFKIIGWPTGTLKPETLFRRIEDYKADGIIFDLVSVDYADIMAANYRSDNFIENMRSIYIDLRAGAQEAKLALLTATQSNREGAKKSTATMTDVSEDINKVRTADLFLGINATEAEKASGEARLTWIAARNSEDGFSLRIRQDREKLKFLTAVLGKE